MKRTAVTVLAALAGLAFTAAPARANEAPTCTMPTGWYANADEQDRLPTPVQGGLKFEGNDLIHHAFTGTVEDLTHGSFTASPAPDQDSFFSVEVYGTDGGYGTLRWNTATSKWNLVTGGQFYENANPAILVDMPAAHRSHHVVSFGVGYTANPPGTVATTVSAVTFAGQTYKLANCPTASPSPTATSASPTPKPSTAPPSHTPSHTAEPSATPIPGGTSGGLPVTGPNMLLIASTGLGLLVLGGSLVFFARRRRFTS